MMQMKNQDSLLTSAGAARIIGVVPATVRIYERLGKLPAIRTESGIRLFDRGEVEKFAAEQATRKAGAAK